MSLEEVKINWTIDCTLKKMQTNNLLEQSWDLVAHFELISESTPTVLLLPLVS